MAQSFSSFSRPITHSKLGFVIPPTKSAFISPSRFLTPRSYRRPSLSFMYCNHHRYITVIVSPPPHPSRPSTPLISLFLSTKTPPPSTSLPLFQIRSPHHRYHHHRLLDPPLLDRPCRCRGPDSRPQKHHLFISSLFVHRPRTVAILDHRPLITILIYDNHDRCCLSASLSCVHSRHHHHRRPILDHHRSPKHRLDHLFSRSLHFSATITVSPIYHSAVVPKPNLDPYSHRCPPSAARSTITASQRLLPYSQPLMPFLILHLSLSFSTQIHLAHTI